MSDTTQNSAHSSSSSDPEAAPVASVSSTVHVLSEIIGEESLKGQRMGAGALLALVDLCAGRIAWKHSKGPVATASFDRVDFLKPVHHLDLVKVEGRLLVVGASSMTIEVKGYRRCIQPYTSEEQKGFAVVCKCFVTMVAINETGRPRKGIASITCLADEEQIERDLCLKRKERFVEFNRMLDELDQRQDIKAADVLDPLNEEGKEVYVTMPETEVVIRRQFLPRHQNINQTIFGGDLLMDMAKVATHTARQFIGGYNVLVLAMNRISFKQPVSIRDYVEMSARVVYVRRHVLEVEIDVVLEKMDGSRVKSHSGYFTVINVDEAGKKRPLTVGLRLEDDDQASLKRYLKAKERFRFYMAHDILSTVI